MTTRSDSAEKKEYASLRSRKSPGRRPSARARARVSGEPQAWVLAADTDGIDGIEDNAGAIVAPDTLARARALGLRPGDHLDRNDAYAFFSALSDLVVTGPTFTNVNDFRALLVLNP